VGKNDQITLLAQRWRITFLWCGAGFGVLAILFLLLWPTLVGKICVTCMAILILALILLFQWNGVIVLKQVIPLLLTVSILFPYIRLPGPIPDVRPEFIIALIAWCLIILSSISTGKPIHLRYCNVYKWFAIFAIVIMLSITYIALVNNQMPIWRDFWEIVKLLLYFIIFVLVSSQRITHNDLRRYYKLALIVFLISACFGFLQYINFAGINELISPYYAPTQIRGLLVHGRITGTTPNPNEFGALMVLAASLALSGALVYREWKLRLFCWFSLLIYGIALLLTLSRTSLVCLFIASIIIIFLFYKEKGLKGNFKRLFPLVLLGFLIIIVLLQVLPEKALARFSELLYFTEAPSWQARVGKWKTHYDIWLGSPLFGWGPGKAEMSTIVDNEWLLILRRYGLFGLISFISLFGCLYNGLFRIGRDNPETSVIALTVALRGTLISYSLYMMLASVYHSMQLMPILLLLLGLAYSQWRQHLEVNKTLETASP